MKLYFSIDSLYRLYVKGYKITLIDNLTGEIIETITDTETHALFHYDLKYKTRFKLSKYTYWI
jgi:hypothetical protein